MGWRSAWDWEWEKVREWESENWEWHASGTFGTFGTWRGLSDRKAWHFPKGPFQPVEPVGEEEDGQGQKNKKKQKKKPRLTLFELWYTSYPQTPFGSIHVYPSNCIKVKIWMISTIIHFSPGEQCRAVLDLIGLNALVFMTFFVYLLFFKFFKFFFLLCFGVSLSITWCLYKGQGEISSAYYFLGWIALSKEQQSLVRPGCPFFFPLLKLFFFS